MAKNSKNLQKVQDQLDGTYKGKLQVGMHTPDNIHANREVGERWIDADGKEWEQKEGFKVKKGNQKNSTLLLEVYFL